MLLYLATPFAVTLRSIIIGDGLQGYSGQSVFLMRLFGAIIGLATIAFVSIETFRPRK